jgi:hypothetical protein
MATATNLSLIALGINEVREGNDIVQGGVTRIAEGICEYWFTPIRWSYGRDDNEVSGVCNLGDMFKGRRNEKSEQDSKFIPAMYRAVAEAFGIDGDMSNADKVAFRRGFAIAAARHAGSPVKFVDAKVSRKGKSVSVRAVQVPAVAAFELDKPDGSLTELGRDMVNRIKSNLELEGKDVPDDDKLLARAKALNVNCVGGKHPVFGKVPSATDIATKLEAVAIDGGVMPPKANRDRGAKSAKFGEALDYVIKCMDEVLGDKGESDFAPSDAVDAKLREVAERIAAYFVN